MPPIERPATPGCARAFVRKKFSQDRVCSRQKKDLPPTPRRFVSKIPDRNFASAPSFEEVVQFRQSAQNSAPLERTQAPSELAICHFPQSSRCLRSSARPQGPHGSLELPAPARTTLSIRCKPRRSEPAHASRSARDNQL